jgi:beta-glucosidase
LPLFDNNYETVQEGRGYRYFDAKGIEPLFPFGFGLSYTRFQCGELHIAPKTIDRERLAAGDKVRVWLELQNVGNRSGDEIVQLYVHDVESSLPRPPKELKGFQRVSLQPREKKRVAFALGADAFSFYDPNRRQWVAEPGQFEIMVGPSSRHLPTHATLTLR